MAANKLPNNFAVNSGRVRPSATVPHVPPPNTKANINHMNNFLSSGNTNAMNTMTTQSSSQSHLYMREDNLTRNKHASTHIHHNHNTTEISSSKDDSSHNMYSISSHSSYGTGPDSNHHKNYDNNMNNDDTLVHPNLRQQPQHEKAKKSHTSNSNSNSIESLGSTMYFVPTRNISTADHIGEI